MSLFFKKVLLGDKPLDISKFDDPLCGKTKWEPLRRRGFSHRTHYLTQDKVGNFLFKPHLNSYLIVLVPLTVFLYLLKRHFLGNAAPDVLLTIMYLGMVITFIVLGPRLYGQCQFDLVNGWYYEGYQSPKEGDLEKLKNRVDLKDIGGLQIIGEEIHMRRPYTSNELNLVLKNGDRINVVDQGNIKKLRKEAQQLSEGLGVPLWDASE